MSYSNGKLGHIYWMKYSLYIITFFAITASHLSCNRAKQPTMPEKEQLYSEGIIETSEVKLQYLDWGGSGQPLILIHGVGDSPYIFEDLAAALRSNFRIIAYARRGHGKSETSDSDYSNSRLVSDLKLLLDSLEIDKASLLGWSFGGNEITEFAAQFPDRTNKLIYLEAGYDLADRAFKTLITAVPKSPFPDSTDLSSVNAFRKWYHGFWFPDVDWNPTLEANLQASIHINPDSSVTTLPNDNISKMLLESTMTYHRPYEKVQAQALVLYTKPFFSPAGNAADVIKSYEKMEGDLVDPWRQRSMDQVKKELKGADIRMMPNGTHVSCIFLSREYLIEVINSFLVE